MKIACMSMLPARPLFSSTVYNRPAVAAFAVSSYPGIQSCCAKEAVHWPGQIGRSSGTQWWCLLDWLRCRRRCPLNAALTSSRRQASLMLTWTVNQDRLSGRQWLSGCKSANPSLVSSPARLPSLHCFLQAPFFRQQALEPVRVLTYVHTYMSLVQ